MSVLAQAMEQGLLDQGIQAYFLQMLRPWRSNRITWVILHHRQRKYECPGIRANATLQVCTLPRFLIWGSRESNLQLLLSWVLVMLGSKVFELMGNWQKQLQRSKREQQRPCKLHRWGLCWQHMRVWPLPQASMSLLLVVERIHCWKHPDCLNSEVYFYMGLPLLNLGMGELYLSSNGPQYIKRYWVKRHRCPYQWINFQGVLLVVQVRQKLRHHGIDQKYGSESFSLPLKPPYVIS